MKPFVTAGLLALLLLASASAPRAQEVTGLSGWSLFLDPGHSQNENVGVFGYSEARKVLRVGLALHEMLLTRTDIDTVYLSRTTDSQQVSLSQRVDAANTVGASYFHSIHSNAAGPDANSLFVLWPQQRDGSEGVPMGGKRMAETMGPELAGAMRIPAVGTNGGFGECDFYGVSSCRTVPKGSRNFVQSFTDMASTLSEAGFHTNPTQNQRNMNAEWKRLEAQAMYWAILDWHGVPRSTHRIATGFVTDAESGRPINGATVEIDGRTYTTDTFESLFNQYSDDPDELANGFYYLEDLSPGTHTVTVMAEGYATATAEVTMLDTDFSFADVQLVSTVPPVVTEADPADGEDSFRITDPIRLSFSRPLDPATTTPAFSLVADGGAAVTGTVTYEDGGFRLVFTPDAPLDARTDYTLTLAGTATTANGSPLDGDGDGTGGDDFVLTFTSSFPDVAAPRLTQSFPAPNSRDAALRPVITVAFDEPVVPSTLDGRVTLETTGGEVVSGRYEHALAGDVGEDPQPRSVVSFAPDADLMADATYRFAIEPGVEDAFLNATTGRYSFTFRTGTTSPLVRTIDDFEGASIADNWWVPQQSGSTVGHVTDSTNAAPSPRAHLLGGTTSMRIDYGWDDGVGPWLVREYLAGGAPRAVIFDDSYTLQARVFGDGNGTLFRFAVDDGTSGGDHEVSPWIAVDWYGWRPVTWDLGSGDFGTWIGNGAWDNPSQLRFDSIQLSYDGASPRFGELYVDDLQLTRAMAVATEDDAEGVRPITVLPVRPNPFRGRTEIGFALAAPSDVTVRVFNAIGQQVAVLADGQPFSSGAHALTWEADGVAAGVYVARIEAGAESATVRMVLAR